MPLPSWFPEFDPLQQVVFDSILDQIENTYRQFGYLHIETPVVELNNILLAKTADETSQQIFWLRWLAQDDPKDYSLRYDHTVPLARYVLDHQSFLQFPFKRYAIGNVRRGERAQKWRYRQFYQCDVDVIWPDEGKENYLQADGEVIAVWALAISRVCDVCSVEWTPTMLINHRKVAGWVLEHITEDTDKQASLMTLLDKRYKMSREERAAKAIALWIHADSIHLLIEIIENVKTMNDLDTYMNAIDNEQFREWVEQLRVVFETLEAFVTGYEIEMNYHIDFSIVRWLDYYTWTVFECMFEEHREWWSVCSGWRYEWLTAHIDPKQSFSWVWISIGASRLYAVLLDHMQAEKTHSLDFLFLHFPETYTETIALAGRYASEWYSVEVYPVAVKLTKQFKYADKKWIGSVIAYGLQEKENGYYTIKDMTSGEETQVTVDS